MRGGTELARNGEWENYESTLRNIVLLSADVLPAEVAGHLRETALRGYWKAKEEVFRQLIHTAHHLPKECADYAIDYLTAKKRDRNNWMSVKYGIENYLHLFPPSQLRGPFLALLRAKEDEGLRLVHTLANTAVDSWRLQEQAPDPDETSRTPLPVTIKLSSGAQDFWGDQNVYFWFRPNSNAPHAISSALMALELWMEEQIEAGRDAVELFEKVMSGGRCVAVPGICLGIALACPQKCLQAALPIVSAPAIWSMDISRYAADHGGSFSVDPFDQNKVHYQARAERDKRPQRKTEIRHFVMRYMLSGNNALREQFQQSLAAFSQNLPFSYEEEKNYPAAITYRREEVERYQIYGDLANYRMAQTETGAQVWAEPPDRIKARGAKEQAQFNETCDGSPCTTG